MHVDSPFFSQEKRGGERKEAIFTFFISHIIAICLVSSLYVQENEQHKQERKEPKRKKKGYVQ